MFSPLDCAFYLLWSSGFPVSLFGTLSPFSETWELKNNLSWLCCLTQQWLQYSIWKTKSVFLTKQDYFCLFCPHKQYLIWASVAQILLFLNAGILSTTQGRLLCSPKYAAGKSRNWTVETVVSTSVSRNRTVDTLETVVSLFCSVKKCRETWDGNVLICFQVQWKFSVPKNEESKQELLKN